MVVTRFIADMLYEEKNEADLSSFWGSTGLMLIAGGILYGIFLIFSGVGLIDKFLCFELFGELIVTWNAMSYLTAIKDYRGIMLSFLAAIAVTFLSGALLLFLGISHVEALMADFDSRIDALKAFAEGKTAIVGMTTSGSFNVLGNDGRCSIIGKEIGFENIGVDANIDTSTHGNEASFEFIVDKNPDYIFAMDRDAAIGTDGAQMAQEILENELVESTDAYKNGHVVYLAHSNVWYTAEGGIQALNEMLSDLESALL